MPVRTGEVWNVRLVVAVLMLAMWTVAVAPGAQACAVEDPTATTPTCVDAQQTDNGDCDSAEGAQSAAVHASTVVPFVGGLSLDASHACHHDGTARADGASANATVTTQPVGSETNLGADPSRDSTGVHCSGVLHSELPFGQYTRQPLWCPIVPA